MLVLGVETSTTHGSIAIGRKSGSNFELLYSLSWHRQNSHGELLTGAIEAALQFCNLRLQDIDAFAVSVGPGSFTGIRIGLSAIKALAYSEGKPVITFNSLEILVNQVPPDRSKVLALINAHKSQCYLALFAPTKKGWKVVKKPCAMRPEAIEKLVTAQILCVGEGYLVFESIFKKAFKKKIRRESRFSDYPLASTLVRMALEAPVSRKTSDWKSLEPLYIRGSEAEEKLKSGLLKPLPEL